MKKKKAQSSTQKLWIDETGFQLPYSRTTKSERLQERASVSLLNKALSINSKLVDFKSQVTKVCDEVFETFMQENDVKNKKGNFTFYNFDRSIKVEVSVSDRIEFDDLQITACQEKLDEFIDNNVESKDHFIKQLVMDAFETSRGKLDAKKVMSLLKYKSKISNPLFQQAMKFLEDSIRRPDSKKYFRIWVKDESGKYQNVDLNFSSI